jgi:hypothetical protein
LQGEISTAYDGKRRRLFPFVCPCGIAILIPKHCLSERRYCSVNCTAKPDTRVDIVCALCSKTRKLERSKVNVSKTGIHFCSRRCKDEAQSLEVGILKLDHYGDGKRTYRQRALKLLGAKCSVCGYDEYIEMLDVDHKDSNRGNNQLENLQVLCVWHHALKTRLGGLAQFGQSAAPATQMSAVRIC